MSRHDNEANPLGRRIARRTAVVLLGINLVGGAYVFLGGNSGTLGPDAGASVTQKPAMPDNAAAVLNPIERVAFSNDWRRTTQRTVKAGGHVFTILRTGTNSCEAVRSEAPDFKLYVMQPTEISTPSSKGGRTGTFYEALLPRNSATCGNSRYIFAEWKPRQSGPVEISVGLESVTVEIQLSGAVRPPKRALQIALTNSYLIKGHCDKYCPREAELAHKYSRLLSRHGIQPMQNWIGVPPIRNGYLDLDRRAKKSMSFRQTTMAYAHSGLVGFPRMDGYRDKLAYLRALEATVQREGLQGKAWVYAVDEPKVDKKLVDKLRLYKLLAPSVKVMVTTAHDPSLDSVVDIFAPVFNRFVKIDSDKRKAYRGKELWSYASCMGSCGPNRKSDINVAKKPGADTRLADFLIDRPAELLFSFFKSLEAMKAAGALYYEATEAYPLVRKGLDLIADPWNFGGNGDGLLIYPGRPGQFGLTTHQPLPSLRLKLIRHAIETYW